MVQKFEDRPPFVRFEVRAEEDRTKSLAAGHYVGNDVDYALITPMGSKDCIERKVDEWFAKLEQDVAEGRCPREWLRLFKDTYKEWKEGREAPVNGISIKDWPPVSPAQLKTLQSVHIRTVEDLASANEEVIHRLGMGGRALKQKAIDWLNSASTNGVASEELAALRSDNENIKVRNEQLEQQVKLLSERLDTLAPPSPPPAAPAGKPVKL